MNFLPVRLTHTNKTFDSGFLFRHDFARDPHPIVRCAPVILVAAATAVFGFAAQGDEGQEEPDERLMVAAAAPDCCELEANRVSSGVQPWFPGTARREGSSILDAVRVGGDIGGGPAIDGAGDVEVIASLRSDPNAAPTPVGAVNELEKCIVLAKPAQFSTGQSFSNCKSEFQRFLSSHDESVRQSVRFRALDEIARTLSLDIDNRIHLEESLRVAPHDSHSIGSSRATNTGRLRPPARPITDRTQRTEGLVALDWNDATMLREVTADGKQVIAEWSSAPMSVARPDGACYFEARYCAALPFSGESCWSVDSRVVVLASSEEETQYPEPLTAQLQYEYRIRKGDFNGDGREEFHVERLAPGPADGSMQSYVIWEDSSGSARTTALDPAYAEAAASAPISGLTLNQTDVNADGYADHVITGLLNLKTIPGFDEPVEHSVLVYAPGVASDKTVPQGTKTMDQEFHNFFGDVARGMNDRGYFKDLVGKRMTPQPVWGPDWKCEIDKTSWGGSERRDVLLCGPKRTVVGFRSVPRDYTRAELATTAIQAAFDNDLDLTSTWNLSNVMAEILGVQLFGFNELGVFIGGNFHKERASLAAVAFWNEYMQ